MDQIVVAVAGAVLLVAILLLFGRQEKRGDSPAPAERQIAYIHQAARVAMLGVALRRQRLNNLKQCDNRPADDRTSVAGRPVSNRITTWC